MVIISEYEIVLCDCCVIAEANADTSGHDFYCVGEPEPMAHFYATLPTNELHCVAIGDARTDFSRADCDGCGVRLTGARTDCAVLVSNR